MWLSRRSPSSTARVFRGDSRHYAISDCAPITQCCSIHIFGEPMARTDVSRTNGAEVRPYLYLDGLKRTFLYTLSTNGICFPNLGLAYLGQNESLKATTRYRLLSHLAGFAWTGSAASRQAVTI